MNIEEMKHVFNLLFQARFENHVIVEMWVTLEGHTILKQIGIDVF